MPTTLQRIALLSTSLIIVGSLSGCGGAPALPSGSPQAAPVPEMTPSYAAASSSPLSAGKSAGPGPAQSVTLDSVGWLAGFKVAVGSASVDPATSVVTVDVVLTNTSQVDESFSAVGGEVSLNPGDDSGLVALRSATPTSAVVAGTSARSTLGFQGLPGVSLAQAVLVLGKGVNHQWLVPLQPGATSSGESPVAIKAPGRLTTRGRTYLNVTSAQVLPWSCAGIAPSTAFRPSPRTRSVIALAGTAGAGAVPPQGTAIEAMSVTAPDGTTAGVLTLPSRTWFAHQSTANELLCLPIPAGLAGRYVLRITDSFRKTVTARIDVP